MRLPQSAAALVLIGGLLALGACASESGKSAPDKATDASAKKDGAAADGSSGKTTKALAAQAKAKKPAKAGAGVPNMDELRQNKSVREQARSTLVEHYMKTGEQAFAQSRFEEARAAFGSALDLDPDSDKARRRMNEIGAILGERLDTAEDALENASEEKRVRAAQAKVEVANLSTLAQAKAGTGDYAGAVKLYERALVIVQLWEPQVDFSPTGEGLRALITEARNESDTASETKRRRQLQEAMDLQRAEATRQRAQRRARLQELFSAANKAMEGESYQSAQNLAEEILRSDPTSKQASRLRDIARKARLSSREDHIARSLQDEWKHVFEELSAAMVPQITDYTFPDSWGDLQGRRQPRGLSDDAFAEDEASQATRNRLEAMRTPVDFTDAPLEEAVSWLSKISDVNIVILPEAKEGKTDEELTIDQLRLESPVPISTVLDLITDFRGLAWNIEGGLVQITTPEGARGASIVQLYDVKDLATPINNFPGEEINLDPTGEFAPEEEIPEPMPEFLLDQIVELIQENVDQTVWEEAGSVEGLPPGTLVVKAPPATHKNVQALLDGLRGAGGLQVSIETRFLRVSDNFLQEVGVDLRGLGDQSGGVGIAGKGGVPGPGGLSVPVTFDDVFFGSAGSPSGVGTGNDTGVFYNLNSDGDIRARFENLFDVALGKDGTLTNLGGLSFQGTLIDDTQLEVILRAVEKSDRSTIVTAPRLTAYNGQRANVTVLDQISYIADFDVEIAQLAQIGDPIVQTLRDGVILDVRPTVSADRRFITMELRPTVAILQQPIATFQTTLANGPPVTIQLPEVRIRRVRTTVTMPDGGTLMLGGLKFFEERRMESSVPWINKIPIANFFMARKGTYLERRTVLILVRSRILRPEENEPVSAR